MRLKRQHVPWARLWDLVMCPHMMALERRYLKDCPRGKELRVFINSSGWRDPPYRSYPCRNIQENLYKQNQSWGRRLLLRCFKSSIVRSHVYWVWSFSFVLHQQTFLFLPLWASLHAQDYLSYAGGPDGFRPGSAELGRVAGSPPSHRYQGAHAGTDLNKTQKIRKHPDVVHDRIKYSSVVLHLRGRKHVDKSFHTY